jgi:asparagine synthase (glutamine-hydrolysing)
MLKRSLDGLKIDHTEIRLRTDGFLPTLRKIIRYHDAPLYTISFYIGWQLQQAIARDGYRVSISGVGADELFSGYYDHQNAYLAVMADHPGRYAEALKNWKTKAGRIVRNPYLIDPDYFKETPLARDHIYLNREKFAGFFQDPWDEPFAETIYTGDLLRNRMANELFHEAVPVILHEDDLNAMHHSVENRSPFLDRKLFETAQSIPTRHLVRDGLAKAPLREAMRGLVPDEVLNNPRKVGFNAPVMDLLDPSDTDIRTLVLEGPLSDQLNLNKVRDLLSRKNLKNSESKFLFNLINAQLFLEQSRDGDNEIAVKDVQPEEECHA